VQSKLLIVDVAPKSSQLAVLLPEMLQRTLLNESVPTWFTVFTKLFGVTKIPFVSWIDWTWSIVLEPLESLPMMTPLPDPLRKKLLICTGPNVQEPQMFPAFW
jgi:hypothetical protein